VHELSIAEGILEIVTDTVRSAPGAVVEKVFVDVGTLVAVVPDSLDFCYTAITADTPLEGSRLVIRQVPICVRCRDCGGESEVQSFIFRCPHCDGGALETLSGNELSVTEIEVQ
jgi:hydrogenase nickel incorporation protein HypA/HybF